MGRARTVSLNLWEVRDRLGDPRGCPGLIGGPSGRSGTGRGILGEVLDGRRILEEVWNGSGDPWGGPGRFL